MSEVALLRAVTSKPIKVCVPGPITLSLPLILRGYISEGLRRRGYHSFGAEALQIDIGERFILDGEAFPPGRYRLSLGPKLRFVVP